MRRASSNDCSHLRRAGDEGSAWVPLEAADAEVTVEANETPTELLVTVDGQVGTSFVKGEKLRVRRSDNPVRIVRFPGATFFERMRVKLGWGGLPERDEMR